MSRANLEVERFVEKAKWLFRKISRPEHRSSLKSWFGAETGESFTLPLPPLESGAAATAPDTPLGWAYPVLVGAGVKCGRNPSADWGRALPFPLPLTQSGGLRPSRHLPRSFGG